MAVGIVALFYLARGSNSLVVNTVAAMVLLTLVAYSDHALHRPRLIERS